MWGSIVKCWEQSLSEFYMQRKYPSRMKVLWTECACPLQVHMLKSYPTTTTVRWWLEVGPSEGDQVMRQSPRGGGGIGALVKDTPQTLLWPSTLEGHSKVTICEAGSELHPTRTLLAPPSWTCSLLNYEK